MKADLLLIEEGIRLLLDILEDLENDGEEEDQNFLQELIELYERLEK